jgi:Mrp family chromosome partitioning ATPase
LGIPSAAWFVEKTNQCSALLSDDQYKRFSTVLLRNRSRGAESVFAFTSARVGGGCTAVVTQLSKRLVGLGARVLVIDANTLATHSPLHHIGPGLTDHLAGKAKLSEIVVRDSLALPGIDLVPLGTLREGGLKHLDRLKAAMLVWQNQYDLVLMDIPPLLPSADAEALVDVAKQVFVVVEAGGVTKAELVQVRGLLAKQAPEAVGLVVNRVLLDPGNEAQQQHMLESITGGRFSQFMSTPGLSLQFDLLALRLQRAKRALQKRCQTAPGWLRFWSRFRSRFGPRLAPRYDPA